MAHLQPTCEDYHSEDSEDHVLEGFRRSPGGQANVAAKRSHPSDLRTNTLAPEKTINLDIQSDSGYSNITLATRSTADSGLSAASQSPPTAPSSAASVPPQSPAVSKRRPTIVTEDRKSSQSSQNSPRKPLQRQPSTASKRPSGRRATQTEAEDCNDPNCTECGPNAIPSRRRRTEALLDTQPSDQRSQRSDPMHSYTTPPSPSYPRQPTQSAHGAAFIQPEPPRRRPSSTQPRPMSYHGELGQGYWPPAPYPSPPQEAGPPPAMARYNMQQHPQMPPYMMGHPAPGYYPSSHSTPQTSPPYELSRPLLSARTSSNYQTRLTGRPQSIYGTTLITQDQGDQPMPSARFPNAPSARQERFPQNQSQFESESSDFESSEDEEDEPEHEPPVDNDRVLMPPPKMLRQSKPKPERRPSIKHAHTAQVLDNRRVSISQSHMLPERPKERVPRPRVNTAAPSRAASVSRPALVQPKAQSSYETPRAQRVMVENSRSRRHQSYQTEKQYDVEEKRRHRDPRVYVDDRQVEERRHRRGSIYRGAPEIVEDKRRNRDSKMYYDDRDDAILIPERPRRRADTIKSIRDDRDEYITEPKDRRSAANAEAYQQLTRGTNDPLADAVHKAALKRMARPGADAMTTQSDDRRTRVSQARTAITNGGGNGEIRLRVDASAPLSLSFNGDMEGRTLQFQPAEGGMADIVIGSSTRDSESVYQSERGSVVVANKRRSLVANSARRAEEESTRSSNSSQARRREPERRPLRKRPVIYDD